MIGSHPFQSPDIDRIIYNITSAAGFTGMLTDKTAGSGEWIVLANQTDGISITSFPYKGNISRDIHMGRTERNTWDRLFVLAGTSFLADMFFIIFPASDKTLIDHMCGFIPDGTVSAFHDRNSQFFHKV